MQKTESRNGDTLSDQFHQNTGISRRTVLQAFSAGVTALGLSDALRAVVDDSLHPVSSVGDGVDFRYSPHWWQTAICFPDDPDKALVGKEGQLLFDYGVRVDEAGKPLPSQKVDPYIGNFDLVIQPGLATETKWIRQETLSARAPIVQTWRDAEGVEVGEQIFLAPPSVNYQVPAPRLARVDSLGGMVYGCAKPVRECSAAFADCAVQFAAPIRFQLGVAPGQVVTIVYGFCEAWERQVGRRAFELRADGAPQRIVDPTRDFGPNQPGVYKLSARDDDRDGIINILVSPTASGKRTTEPDIYLNALWAFTDNVPSDEDIILGRADRVALAHFPAVINPPRRAVILMRLRNSSPIAVARQPLLRIRTSAHAAFNELKTAVHVGNGTYVSGSNSLELIREDVTGEYLARMPAMSLAPGESVEVAFAVDRHPTAPIRSLSAYSAQALLTSAEQWWKHADLPYTAISVPDPSMQRLVESCIRNIWQARELKVSGPAFQVGPTVYRGLWIVDGSFLLEAVGLLGRGLDARRGIEYLLSQQRSDGSFEIIPRFWKENGIVLWAVTRHAVLTQGKDWLRQYWPALQRVIEAVRRMRHTVSEDPQSLDYRLMPAGFVDGGIDNRGDRSAPEYSTVYWTLIGLKAFIAAADWLGDKRSAHSCRQDYDDLYGTFRKALKRDTLTDQYGNHYVPVMMGNEGHYAPQKGQWSFCHAVYPGQVFSKDDPFVQEQLAMLQATKVQGMVCGTGWLTAGIWSYFASFYGHAQLWQGNAREAVSSLYAFAQHASPTRVWREEQMPRSELKDVPAGDMPHNWASAELIRLVTHLIQLDRGDELHLLEGFPREWAQGGMVTRLNGVMTPFGPLFLEIRIASDRHTASLKVKRLTGTSPRKIFLHLAGWTDRNEVLELPTDRDLSRSIKLQGGASN